MATHSNPSAAGSTEPASESRLLQLPPELRNRIYEYALSTGPWPLYCSCVGTTAALKKPIHKAIFHLEPPPWPRSFEHDPITELNQLKYVCRQLRVEAAGLELKINKEIKISRTDRDARSPIWDLLVLFRQYPVAQLMWLSKIIIADEALNVCDAFNDKRRIFTAPDIAQAAQLARRHPRITFKYIVGEWRNDKMRHHQHLLRDEDLVWTLTEAHALVMALRGTCADEVLNELFAWSLDPAAPQEYGGKWRGGITPEQLQAPNLRFYPRFPDFDEVQIREWCKPYEPQRLSNGETLLDAWIRLHKEWCKNGI
ncbi:hypothetical protein BU26DRAFT_579547 [Trematosphaeria pertusa]|uniref:F-box domain-containing protein n=1 Tax=Trematosphaeria pertusa TaxID=390896 RepID=A0A6A6I2W1_9PLEO|nr:uncharacterized protein BU26DRAFT_579547 [Trematosphaeria pertusa]KAF2244814.1 hypothetical protein BU26DRAFT_579547 [Trematosphaeria pertusa]